MEPPSALHRRWGHHVQVLVKTLLELFEFQFLGFGNGPLNVLVDQLAAAAVLFLGPRLTRIPCGPVWLVAHRPAHVGPALRVCTNGLSISNSVATRSYRSARITTYSTPLSAGGPATVLGREFCFLVNLIEVGLLLAILAAIQCLGKGFARACPWITGVGLVARLARHFREERKVSKPPCSTVRDPLLASRALLGTYFANIAAALVRHGGRISKSSPKVLRVAWERLAAEPVCGRLGYGGCL